MGDPQVIPLWYGEGDLPTLPSLEPPAAALQTGHTFYTYKAGLPELRATIADDRAASLPRNASSVLSKAWA